MHSLAMAEGASATQIAQQSVTSHVQRFRSLNVQHPAAPCTATLIADGWQLPLLYVARPAASFKEH